MSLTVRVQSNLDRQNDSNAGELQLGVDEKGLVHKKRCNLSHMTCLEKDQGRSKRRFYNKIIGALCAVVFPLIYVDTPEFLFSVRFTSGGCRRYT